MNLYRNFGSLMEAWVSEEHQYSDSALIGNNDEDSSVPSSDTRANLFSESVDSGMETASSDTSSPTAYSFVSTDAETDVFPPSPALASPAPSSSSSPTRCLCPGAAQCGSAASKVEQVLRRNDLRSKPERLTVEEVLRRRPRSSVSTRQNTSAIVRGQRSQSFIPRKTANPTVSVRQMSVMWRRQPPVSCEAQTTEDSSGAGLKPEAAVQSEEETAVANEERGEGERSQAERKQQDLCDRDRKELSPGLSYLEHVCQMLEEVARQQMQKRTLKMETDALQEQQDTQSESKAAEEDLSSLKRVENTENVEHSSSEPEVQKDPYRNFRQRSASDTTIATLHLRNLNADCRGQHLSTCDLLERAEEDKQRFKILKKSNKNWKLKIGSLKRDGSTKSSQLMQPPEKNTTRRRLSKLFSRRKNTLPE